MANGLFFQSTLCYIEKDDRYLMLYRNKKEADANKGKWIGVGGKFEEGESPEDCMLREVKEETGLSLTDYEYRGIITFVSDEWGTEYMHLFTAKSFTGHLKQCDEGELRFIEKGQLMNLNLWEGDREFLKLLLSDTPFFSMKLTYRGDDLVGTHTRVYGIDEMELLTHQAKTLIPQRVEYYARKLNVTYGKITIRNQKTRWGSCSSKGNLNFNVNLMRAPLPVIDSVVVHELCHRKEMNHSRNFYKLVYDCYPEYDKWHGWLKKNGSSLLKR